MQSEIPWRYLIVDSAIVYNRVHVRYQLVARVIDAGTIGDVKENKIRHRLAEDKTARTVCPLGDLFILWSQF